jgi:uncharacterized protein (PEP-CTERM system associated)
MMPMSDHAARVCSCSATQFPLLRSRPLIAVLASAWLGSASAQTLPSGAGYQIGDGTLAVEAERPRGQGWWTSTSLTSVATLTNNANYGTSDVRAGDLVLELMPSLSFNREGGRARVNGYVALNMLGYVDGTQVNRILPRANVLANLEAVDNFFFIDASLFADQFVENPFLPSNVSASTNNLYTSTQARLVPYFRGNVGPNARWEIRSDNSYTWTSQADNPLGNVYYARNLAEIVRDPIPFGVTLRLTNDFTRVQDQLQPDQTLNTALALFDFAVSPQFTFGIRGGYENTTYTAEETSGPIYGASLSWRPSPVTSFVGYWEERFYGPSYRWDFSHRQRRVASNLSFYRTITTYPQVLFQIPATNSVSGLLDAILIARFPDPVDRANQIQDLINRQGLPQSLPGGAYIFNQSANILTGGNATWALIGARNTLALNLFYLKTQYLPDARVPPTFLAINNNTQQGGGVTLSHRLTPVISLNGTLSTQMTRGDGPTEGVDTREGLARLQVNWQLSARSTLFVGSRYQFQNATGAAFSSSDSTETAVYTGLFHRL